MKLVHIITGLEVGGAEMFLLRLVERLTSIHAMEVISLSANGPIGERLERLGIPVTVLGMKRGRFDPAKFFQLALLLRRMKPDLVHTWMYHANLLGGLAAKMARVPAIVWAIRRSNPSRRVDKRSTMLVVRECALLSHFIPNRILCVAETARETHIRFGYASGKMTVIPNGYDIGYFHPDLEARRTVRRELGLTDKVPLVGGIARFHVQKGYALFVDVAARLRARVPHAHFLLAGRNVDAENRTLMNWLESRKLTDAVFLLGYRDDVSRIMAALDSLLLPSLDEGLPNVVGEAMACGVPCVVTDVGDAALLVGDTGFVRPSGDAEGLAKALTMLLEMPREERTSLGERARRRIVENFEIGAIVRRYDDLYRTLLGAADLR